MAENIEDTKLRLEAFISENYPNIDTAPGTVFSELVIKMAAYLQNPIFNQLTELNQAKALSQVINSTSDTYSPIIDSIASNYNTNRNSGKKSAGKLKVYLSEARTLYINKGFIFSQTNLNLDYITIADYVITTNPTQTNHIKLITEGSLYYFIIPVEAEKVGIEYQLSDRSPLALGPNLTLSSYISAAAYGNFTSGLPVDTDKVLISRFQQNLTNKSLLNKYSIISNLKDTFPLQTISIIGTSDAEMTRSKHNIFGLTTSGKVDVYVRSSLGIETTGVIKTGTYIGDGKWTFALNNNDVSAFYRIISIKLLQPGSTTPQDSGTLLYTATFDFETPSDNRMNDIYTVTEARYTVYQTCNVIVDYASVPPAAIDDKRDFYVLVSKQTYLNEIQNVLLNPDNRIACADYLVRAAIPCYVSVSMKLFRRNPTVDLPITLIKQDIFKYINSLDFEETLLASKLIDICHNYDITHVELPIKMTGSILGLDNSVVEIQGSNELIIPTNYKTGSTPKTTLFFADYYKPGAGEDMSESIDIQFV